MVKKFHGTLANHGYTVGVHPVPKGEQSKATSLMRGFTYLVVTPLATWGAGSKMEADRVWQEAQGNGVMECKKFRVFVAEGDESRPKTSTGASNAAWKASEIANKSEIKADHEAAAAAHRYAAGIQTSRTSAGFNASKTHEQEAKSHEARAKQLKEVYDRAKHRAEQEVLQAADDARWATRKKPTCPECHQPVQWDDDASPGRWRCKDCGKSWLLNAPALKEAYVGGGDADKNPFHKVLMKHGFVLSDSKVSRGGFDAHPVEPGTRDVYDTYTYTHPEHGRSHVIITMYHTPSGAYGSTKSWLFRFEQTNGIMAPTTGDTVPQLDRALARDLNEDAATNSAGGGAIAGIGVGPKGEPGVDLRKKKKKVVEPPVTEAIAVAKSNAKCPMCGRPTYYKSSDGWRPFCSEDCAKKATSGPKKIKEEVKPDDIFAGTPVFHVDMDTILNARFPKHPRHRYSKYVGDDKKGEAIRQHGRDRKNGDIILGEPNTGLMTYLRRKE